jgi:hypothetical protein
MPEDPYQVVLKAHDEAVELELDEHAAWTHIYNAMREMFPTMGPDNVKRCLVVALRRTGQKGAVPV